MAITIAGEARESCMGRKPIGKKTMSAAERMRRSREQTRAKGQSNWLKKISAVWEEGTWEEKQEFIMELKMNMEMAGMGVSGENE
jgi:hypothetical protein